ncbi:MAG: molybdopterin-dependent oxidoreductase [Chloroflexi bacterium]|nr:molybdopterin-dependent oxidoreductase [Chloroflexota bacterium]MBI4216622.1 molybdopterin-dependent oxidoreductase [Chloroflexota bacterium]
MAEDKISRRQFLVGAGALAGGLATPAVLRPLEKEGPGFVGRSLVPATQIGNPLEYYPGRAWEEVYRNQYSYDRSFTYVCSPNDTHACRINAFVRNGIVTRVEQYYEHQNYQDLYGNRATQTWNPRMCLKGYTFHRRVYGPYRLKYPMVRKGWKEWADAAFPSLSDTPALRAKYKFDSRGTDEFVRLSWDEINGYLARGLRAIATTYSGEAGRRRLLDRDGYQPEMLEYWDGAGTRTMKFRGGMGLLGVIGKYGLYRFSNMMALLDAQVRGVGHEEARGSRNWSNYTWHGDQAPGHPFVHGLQASDMDFNDLRSSKLTIQVGKNLIENKMPESHWLNEIMERGGKIVVIAPEYNPPATKADYWISVRPGLSDTSIFLGITKLLMDKGWYDEAFVKQFTDFPLLVRADTLQRLKAKDLFPGYHNQDISHGPSYTVQGLTAEQRESIGDFVVRNLSSGKPQAITRDDVGSKLSAKGIDPALEWKGKITLVNGAEVEVMTLWEMYKLHLQDYDLDTVYEISGASQEMVERLARDIARRFWDPDFMGKPREAYPISIHYGEGINHYFHATLHNRATYLPLMLVGSIGIKGGGAHTWAGNYKAANFQGSAWTGPGFKGWVAEDPFQPLLEADKPLSKEFPHAYSRDEEVGYWAHGDKALIVDTPKFGRRLITGKSHLPTPTKVIWTTNVNLINNAKWSYELVKNINPKIDMIVTQEIEMTASCEYSDFILPANSWMEFQALEITSSCSNPFLQIWGKEGIKPLYDTRDDLRIMTGVAEKLAELTGDQRFRDYWKFALEGREDVYIDRLLDTSTTSHGYTTKDIREGKYGVKGGALMLFRSYPRIPFWEQIHEDVPFSTDTGRLHAYCDIPEAITHGENFIVHREGPEATPYLPNVIVSTNPYIRPENYGITPEMLQKEVLEADVRTIANNKLAWSEVKKTENPLWRQGFRFLCTTPKSRHTVHSQWTVTDWNFIWSNNFGDPYRMDKRSPGVGEWQFHMNPQAARDLNINDGDYIYVDSNPKDRPYVGWRPDDHFYKVSRLKLRVKYNPAYPYHFTMMKHGSFNATERSVLAHETRPDGRALSADTGYQASFRYGSQQSITRSWLMPMHQTDQLFHKAKASMSFILGFEGDNHGINTVPKETLIKIEKAEDGGMGGKGIWAPATTGYTPASESSFMSKYLKGEVTRTRS